MDLKDFQLKFHFQLQSVNFHKFQLMILKRFQKNIINFLAFHTGAVQLQLAYWKADLANALPLEVGYIPYIIFFLACLLF